MTLSWKVYDELGIQKTLRVKYKHIADFDMFHIASVFVRNIVRRELLLEFKSQPFSHYTDTVYGVYNCFSIGLQNIAGYVFYHRFAFQQHQLGSAINSEAQHSEYAVFFGYGKTIIFGHPMPLWYAINPEPVELQDYCFLIRGCNACVGIELSPSAKPYAGY